MKDDRYHPEHNNPGDLRTPSERDRDRLLYCSAFRRLVGVTQVISSTDSEVAHNRLTHTLRVAQIARRLAQRLIQQTPSKLLAELGGIDPEVVESAALAHDLGHPPFGHVGEEALHEYMDDVDQKLGGYEGNAQSFRIVNSLALRNNQYSGLNLTRATLNAILKYPWLRKKGPRKDKWGVYVHEKKYFDWARELYANLGVYKTVEAELMDYADDITYAVHDVEDFFRAGVIPLQSLAESASEIERFLNYIYDKWRGQGRLPPDFENLRRKAQGLFSLLPFGGPYRGTRKDRADLSSVRSVAITRYINAIIIRQPTRDNPRVVAIDPEVEGEISLLKELTWYYVIQTPRLATIQHGYRKVIRDLLEIYHDNDEKSLVPWWIIGDPGEEDVLQARFAADVVSSFTDKQALAMHQRLTGINAGSFLDWA